MMLMDTATLVARRLVRLLMTDSSESVCNGLCCVLQLCCNPFREVLVAIDMSEVC